MYKTLRDCDACMTRLYR